jgi:hypothetical protein
LPLSGLPLAAQQDLVTGLPELGYTDVWSAELNRIDGFTPLTLSTDTTSSNHHQTSATCCTRSTATRSRSSGDKTTTLAFGQL